MDELITSGLDQPLPIDTTSVYAEVDRIFQLSLEEHEPDIAFSAGRKLISAGRLAGRGLARLLWLMEANWQKYEVDDDFVDAAFRDLGLARITIERYVRDVKLLESGDIPAEHKEKIEQLDMASLNAVATAWASGYDITDEKWEKIAKSSSRSEVLDAMREVKDEPPRKNSLVIRLIRDGDLIAYSGSGKGIRIGWLDIGEDAEIVKKAIARIINGAGILEE